LIYKMGHDRRFEDAKHMSYDDRGSA
jgi:hypothetical protein